MYAQHRIKEVRESKRDASGKKLSGIKIAKQIGITPQYYYDIEKGDRNLSAELASQIADILGVSVDYLLKKTDNPYLSEFVNNEIELNSGIYSTLRLLTDDEGYFFEDLHEDIFEIFGQNLAMLHPEADDFDKWYLGYLESSEDDRSFGDDEHALEMFNKIYNYKNIKHSLAQYSADFEKEQFLNKLDQLMDKHNIKNSSAEYAKEFYENIELSDEELRNQFQITVDGRKLSDRELQKLIEFVRMDRRFGDRA